MRQPALSRLLVASIRAFNRNPWTAGRLELLPRDEDPFYGEDGLWTHHGHPFVDDERFQRAYQRAVKAGGHDYGVRWRVHTILWAAATAAWVEGAFVECGTGRGFMASAICEYLHWQERPFYLYDTFRPAAPDSPLRPFYARGPEEVAQNFAGWPGVRLVVGEIPQTLEQSPEQVAFLHVDLNQAAAEQAAVRHFWPRMGDGSMLVFDDYGFGDFRASREGADELGRELGFSVLASPTGQGIVVKAPRAA